MPTAYVGNKKALVFPTLSDAYIQLPYLDYNSAGTTLEKRFGIWSHQESFTIESIITPYDTNGFGTYDGSTATVNGVKNKYSPQTVGDKWADPNGFNFGAFSQSYQHTSSYTNKKMMIFANTNFQFYLKNISTNNREPSTYCLVFKVIASDNTQFQTTTLESDAIFIPEDTLFTQGTVDDVYIENVKVLEPIKIGGVKKAIASIDTNNNTFQIENTDARNELAIGMEIYNNSVTSCGKITNVAFNTHTTITVENVTPLNGETYAYILPPKLNMYSLNSFHVAASIQENGTMSLFFNGYKVAETTHAAALTVNEDFHYSFDPTDIYIGQYPTEGRATQFVGEIHEIALIGKNKNRFSSLETILPSYDKTLMYYKFEGLDDR